MTRRLWSLLTLTVLVVSVGCGAGGNGELSASDLPAAAARRAATPWRFEATLAHGGASMVVRGVVEDDLRFRAEIEVDGRVLWEEVTADDRRYVRVRVDALDVLLPSTVAGRVLALHPAFAELLSGRWVVEADGAPRELGGADGRRPLYGPLGPAVLLDQVRALEGVPALVGLGLTRYDPDSLSYLRRNDRFPRHEEDGARFDHLPPAYDPSATGVTLSAVRGPFEVVSLWARPDGLARVERLVELPDPRDGAYRNLYDQVRRAGSSRLQALVRLTGLERTIRSSLVVAAAQEGDRVDEPVDAVAAEITPALRSLATQIGPAPPTPLYGPVE